MEFAKLENNNIIYLGKTTKTIAKRRIINLAKKVSMEFLNSLGVYEYVKPVTTERQVEGELIFDTKKNIVTRRIKETSSNIELSELESKIIKYNWVHSGHPCRITIPIEDLKSGEKYFSFGYNVILTNSNQYIDYIRDTEDKITGLVFYLKVVSSEDIVLLEQDANVKIEYL